MRNLRNRRAALLVAFGVLATSLGFAAPANAAAPAAVPAAVSGSGWLRLGHFSPDTKEVDVRVTALSGGSTVLDLAGVGYGDISPYSPLADGTYTVAMVPTGSATWNSPVISSQIKVTSGGAATVAAYGPNSDLQVKAFTDDLTPPTAGTARIRLIQASTKTPTVNVTTTTGVSIARNARAGSATAYAEVPAGPWTFQLTGTGVEDTASADIAAGSVSTLFVLDTADGGLTILPVLDSAATAVTPGGGVQTGGGWLAHSSRTAPAASGGLRAVAY